MKRVEQLFEDSGLTDLMFSSDQRKLDKNYFKQSGLVAAYLAGKIMDRQFIEKMNPLQVRASAIINDLTVFNTEI